MGFLASLFRASFMLSSSARIVRSHCIGVHPSRNDSSNSQIEAMLFACGFFCSPISGTVSWLARGRHSKRGTLLMHLPRLRVARERQGRRPGQDLRLSRIRNNAFLRNTTNSSGQKFTEERLVQIEDPRSGRRSSSPPRSCSASTPIRRTAEIQNGAAETRRRESYAPCIAGVVVIVVDDIVSSSITNLSIS